VKLNARQVGDVTVIDISGRITLGDESTAIGDEVRTLTAGGNTKILLNPGEVPPRPANQGIPRHRRPHSRILIKALTGSPWN
jgi:hypothetical protein